MTDPILTALAFIGLVFAAAAAARILLRTVLVLNLLLRELSSHPAGAAAGPGPRLDLPLAA